MIGFQHQRVTLARPHGNSGTYRPTVGAAEVVARARGGAIPRIGPAAPVLMRVTGRGAMPGARLCPAAEVVEGDV